MKNDKKWTEDVANVLRHCAKTVADNYSLRNMENELERIADYTEEMNAQLAAKDAEIERLNIEFRYKRDECNYHYGAVCEAKADLARVTAENANLRDELCQQCGKYRMAHKGACDGCRWRIPAKQGEEETQP